MLHNQAFYQLCLAPDRAVSSGPLFRGPGSGPAWSRPTVLALNLSAPDQESQLENSHSSTNLPAKTRSSAKNLSLFGQKF